jgi:hypothetical protein
MTSATVGTILRMPLLRSLSPGRFPRYLADPFVHLAEVFSSAYTEWTVPGHTYVASMPAGQSVSMSRAPARPTTRLQSASSCVPANGRPASVDSSCGSSGVSPWSR